MSSVCTGPDVGMASALPTEPSRQLSPVHTVVAQAVQPSARSLVGAAEQALPYPARHSRLLSSVALFLAGTSIFRRLFTITSSLSFGRR